MNEGFPQKNKSENNYGKEPFERDVAHEKVKGLANQFSSYYTSLGYQEHPAVKISSGIDPTVRFIGSHISVFKPEIMEGTIPVPGEYIVQDCIRTKNVRDLLNDTHFPHWGSSFVSLGVITNYDRLDDVVGESLDFFRKVLGIEEGNIRIRVSTKDTDLASASSKAVPSQLLELDTQADKYYQHQIGIEGVAGRSFNIALRDAVGDGFSDIGNIIILENAQKKLGVEVALGSSTILKQMYGLKHVNDCYPVAGLNIENSGLKRKLEDSIIVSATLFREGLKPRATDNRDRILRSYVRAMSYLRSKANMSIDDLEKAIVQFEMRQFPGQENCVSTKIIDYLKSYEADLKMGKVSTKEDRTIASVLME